MDSRKCKGRRIRMVTRKWTHEEEVEILEYIKNFLERNTNEQTSANQFFDKMTCSVKFGKISSSQMRNKLRNLHEKYLKAIDLKVKSENKLDLETLEEAVLSVCPHYHTLHEIFGSAASGRLPFQFSRYGSNYADETAKSDAFFGSDNSDSSDVVQPNSSESPHLNDTDSIHSNQNSQNDLRGTRSKTARNRQSSFHSVLVPEMELHEAPQIKSETEFKRHKSNNENYANGIDNNNEFRNEFENVSFPLQRSEQETPNGDDFQYLFAKERLELEKMCRLKELELKKYQIDSNEKLRIMEIEKDERIERLKLELDFKVQIAKLKEPN